MHPVRRRKKRPNYGVRTVEVNRGKNGFGFTISGQQPCILSCIVAGSPAERAGLRPGDYLVAVNGQSVSKIPHDDVVRLIGSSFGLLKLQIAENYYSDSSDEEALALTRPKPKHPLKPRSGGQNRPLSTPITSTSTSVENRAAKVVRDLRTGAMFVEQELEDELSIGPATVLVRSSNKLTLLPQVWNLPVPQLPPPPRLYSTPQEEQQLEIDQEVYRVLVGYLGTIEMPKELQPGSRLQIVRGCIRRLRAEKRAHTLVLMSIQTHSLVLTNCHKTVLAKYPVERVTFCGSGLDDQKRFFGLITAANRESEDNTGDSVTSSSCHVFAVELRLNGCHADHTAKAETFKLQCTVDASTGLCLEFPASSEPVVAAIKVLYCRSREAGENPDDEPLVANSPQPSNASSTTTTASSNSDSGIGFRDDCGNQSDRIVMVDVQNQRLHIQQMVSDPNDSQEAYNGVVNPPKSCKYDFGLPIVANRSNQCIDEGCSSRLTVRAMPDPVISLSGIAASSRSRSPLSSSSSENETLKMKTRRRVYPVEQTVAGYNFESYHDGPIRSNLSAKSNDEMSISSGTNKSDDRPPLYPSNHAAGSTNKTSTPISFLSRLHEKSDISNLHYSAFAGVGSDARSLDAMSVDSMQSQDPLLSYKLSPKVFGLSRPVATHSLEDLKAVGVCPMLECEEASSAVSAGRAGQQWGSLQELRSFVATCFEAAPTDQRMHSGHEAITEPDETERGVPSWSVSFEKLLEDPAGLHTFAEFLKKEFSHENIYFWVSCEKYRELTDEDERRADAKAIFGRHLCLGALEPVNVDSHARQVTQDSLEQASQTLFMQAQKQIFNLMKFDSYPRFIKSDLHKECLLRQLSGQQLPFPGGEQLDTGLQLHGNRNKAEQTDHKLQKSHSDAEDQRRKSLLPWHRKNRSKSKDRGESEYHKLRQKRSAEDAVSVHSELSSSRSSLASWDLALRGSFSRQSIVSGESVERALCRVILPDGATTVVQTRPNEAVRELVLRLLDKRGLNYSAFQVFTQDSVRPVSLDDASYVLGSKEVRVEQRIVFRLDLPNRKTVGVKAKPSKTLAEVLRPILHKYGYKLDLVTVCLMSENEVLELSLAVAAVDNQRLQVLTRSGEGWKGADAAGAAGSTKLKMPGPTLDEITNRVFEELLQGKTDDDKKTSDQNSVKSEDWGSEHSSGIFGRFLRRDSAVHDKARESRGKGKKLPIASNKLTTEEAMPPPPPSNKTLLITKLKPGTKLLGRPELLSPELYEGLKRAQRSRLEDQRGTEINFELPDFLKDKENAPQAGKKYRKLRKSDTDPPDQDQQQPMGSSSESLSAVNGNKSAYRVANTGSITSSFFDETFTDGIVPTPRKAEEYFLGRSDLLSSITCKSSVNNSNSDDVKSENSSTNNSSMDNTLVDASAFDATLTDNTEGCQVEAIGAMLSPRPHSDPPPLPPKPKHLPVKVSVWNNPSTAANHHPTFRVPAEITNSNTRFVRPNEVKRDPRVCRGRRAVYLDQPSSSFV